MSEIEEVFALIGRGQFARAEERLRGIGADSASATPELQACMAVVLLVLRQFDAGLKLLLAAADRHPARSLSVHARFVRIADRVLDILPPASRHEISLRVGDYFLRYDKADEAREWLRPATEALPDDPWAQFLDAHCRFELTHQVDAIHGMEQAATAAEAHIDRQIIVPGGLPTLWNRIGLAWGKVQNLEAAAANLSRAAEMDPTRPHVRLQLGNVLFRLGAFEEAVTHLAAVPPYAPEYPWAARLHAAALFDLGQDDEALALLGGLVDLDPMDALAHREIGRIHLARGELETAEAALARAYRIRSDLAGLRNLLLEFEKLSGRPLDPDAGLPPLTSIVIPEAFQLRTDDPELSARQPLLPAILRQARITAALMSRDMLSRYGRNKLGYVWAVLQPLIFVLTLTLIFRVIDRGVPLGMTVETFLVTGIVPLICFFMNLQARVAGAVKSGKNLLFFREISRPVMLLSATVLEFVTGVIVMLVILGGLVVFGWEVAIEDPLVVLAALATMSLLGMVIGGLIGVCAQVLPSVQHLSQSLNRIMFFTSGAFFHVGELPAAVRDLLLYNPLMHLVEKVRDGFFVSYRADLVTWSYPLSFVVIGLALLLVCERASRRYMVAAP